MVVHFSSTKIAHNGRNSHHVCECVSKRRRRRGKKNRNTCAVRALTNNWAKQCRNTAAIIQHCSTICVHKYAERVNLNLIDALVFIFPRTKMRSRLCTYAVCLVWFDSDRIGSVCVAFRFFLSRFYLSLHLIAVLTTLPCSILTRLHNNQLNLILHQQRQEKNTEPNQTKST